MKLSDFISPVTGHLTGTNSANYGECVGLVQDWFQVEDEPFFYGNAKDLYANAPGGSYTKGTSWPAPAGSAGVMDGSWGGGLGHTWISLGDGRVFEQNNPLGHAPVVSNYGSTAPKGYIGWILPNNYKGDQDMFTNPVNGDTRDAAGWYAAYTQAANGQKSAEQLAVSLQQQVAADNDQIATLTAQVKQLQSQPPVVTPDTPATPPEAVTVTKDGLWASFKKFLGL